MYSRSFLNRFSLAKLLLSALLLLPSAALGGDTAKPLHFDEPQEVIEESAVATSMLEDLDADGDIDYLGLTNEANEENTVYIRLNNGDGTFEELNATFSERVYPREEPKSMAVANYDADGVRHHFIAIAENYWDGLAVACKQPGTWSYEVTRLLQAQRYDDNPWNVDEVYSVFTDDVDNDSRPDIIATVAKRRSGDLFVERLSVAVFINDPEADGGFAPPLFYDHPDELRASMSYESYLKTTRGTFFVDDGAADLAVSYREPYFRYRSIEVFEGLPGGTFVHRQTIELSGSFSDIHAVDLDGDGYDELAAAQSLDVVVFQNDGNGNLAEAETYFLGLSNNARVLAAADLDSDSDLDILVGGNRPEPSVLINNGEGVLTVARPSLSELTPNYLYGSGRALKATDLNQDGALDVFHAGQSTMPTTVQMNIPYERADMNCDGRINTVDVDPFILALLNQATHRLLYPQCSPLLADMTVDFRVDNRDIDGFVDALLQ